VNQDNSLRDLAEAAMAVGIGRDAYAQSVHHCRPGNWLFLGAGLAAGAIWLLHCEAWQVAIPALLVGAVLNAPEHDKIKTRLRAQGLE
jgi:hypothetical protein